MKLSFDLENIRFLKVKLVRNNKPEYVRLAIKEKLENNFVAVGFDMDTTGIETPQNIGIDFVCHDGVYRTNAQLLNIYKEDGGMYFLIHNPDTIDYHENRSFYRIVAKYDCIYTVDTPEGIHSFEAYSSDISPGSVSIIMPEMVVSRDEMSIIILLPDKEVRAHIRFVRCELHEDGYKMSFEFTDISAADEDFLTDICINKQLSSPKSI